MLLFSVPSEMHDLQTLALLTKIFDDVVNTTSGLRSTSKEIKHNELRHDLSSSFGVHFIKFIWLNLAIFTVTVDIS
jgi:hypothetical protein